MPDKEEIEIIEKKFQILEKCHVPKRNGELRYDSDKVSVRAAFCAMDEYATHLRNENNRNESAARRRSIWKCG